MAWALWINSADCTKSVDRDAQVALEFMLNERATARFTCLSSLVPSRFQEVQIYDQDGTTLLFGGLIAQRQSTERPGKHSLYRTVCDCADYGLYADWCYQTKTYSSSVTLSSVLADLVTDQLGQYGVTLCSSQVDGPGLAPFSWTSYRVSDALRELANRTGYVWQVHPDKSLELFIPGSLAAPHSLAGNDLTTLDAHWRDPSDLPVNQVVLSCGPTGTAWLEQQWVASGSEDEWVTDIPAGGPTAGYVTVNSVYCTVGAGAMYEWSQALSKLSLGWANTPAAGQVIALNYVAQYPFRVTAGSGGSPTIQAQYTAADITAYAQGVEYAQGILAQIGSVSGEVVIRSKATGWQPGQAVPIVLSDRDLNGTYVLTSVRMSLTSDTRWLSELEAVDATVYQGSYLQKWREMSGGGTTTGITALPGTSTGDLGWTPIFVYNVQDFGATGDGVTDDTAAVQAALTAVPATGGKVYFPHGTYKLTGTGVSCLLKSNIDVFGAGMGATLIDGSGVDTAYGAPVSFSTVLYFGEYGADAGATLKHLHLHDFSIKGPAAATAPDKLIFYCGINNVVVERVEFYDSGHGSSGGQVLYNESGPFNGLTVRDCYFHDCIYQYSHCVNVNQLDGTDLLVENCRFERVTNGVFLLGKNIRIVHNTLVDVSWAGIYVGEGNIALQADGYGSIWSMVIAGNTFRGLGKVLTGGYAWSNTVGIATVSYIYAFTDTDHPQDAAIVVANNTFLDTWDDHAVACIGVSGGSLVIGNYACGAVTLASRYAVSAFIAVDFSRDAADATDRTHGHNSTPVYNYVRDNVLEQRVNGNNLQIGLYVYAVENAYLFCSGNCLDAETYGAAITDWYDHDFAPHIVLDGDRISPNCHLLGTVPFNGQGFCGTDVGAGTALTPLYGTTDTVIGPLATVPKVDLQEAAAPATPPAGLGRLFVDTAGRLQYLNDDGLRYRVTGDQNVSNCFLGAGSGNETATGTGNTAIGYTAAEALTDGVANVAVGYESLKAGTGADYNTLIGTYSGNMLTTGEGNAVLGFQALAAMTTHGYAVAVGHNAAAAADVDYLVAVGAGALNSLTSGAGNVAVGTWALHALLTNGNCTAIGENALDGATGGGNTALGKLAGSSLTTGTNGVYLGFSANPSSLSDDNSIVIGQGATGAGSNTAVLGNSAVTDVYLGSDAAVAMLHAAYLVLGVGSVTYGANDSGGAGFRVLLVPNSV